MQLVFSAHTHTHTDTPVLDGDLADYLLTKAQRSDAHQDKNNTLVSSFTSLNPVNLRIPQEFSEFLFRYAVDMSPPRHCRAMLTNIRDKNGIRTSTGLNLSQEVCDSYASDIQICLRNLRLLIRQLLSLLCKAYSITTHSQAPHRLLPKTTRQSIRIHDRLRNSGEIKDLPTANQQSIQE